MTKLEIESEFYPAFNDKGRLARFYTEKTLNQFETKLQNTPIYKDIPMVEIRTLGSSDVFISPVRPKDITDFPKAWAVYQGLESNVIQGTPVSEIQGIDRMQVIYYLSRGIRTAETLAEISDGLISGFGSGAYIHRENARKAVGWSADSVASKRDEELKSLQERVEKLTAALTQRDIEGAAIDTVDTVVTDTPETTEKTKSKTGKK